VWGVLISETSSSLGITLLARDTKIVVSRFSKFVFYYVFWASILATVGEFILHFVCMFFKYVPLLVLMVFRHQSWQAEKLVSYWLRYHFYCIFSFLLCHLRGCNMKGRKRGWTNIPKKKTQHEQGKRYEPIDNIIVHILNWVMIHNLPTTGFTNLGWNQHPSPFNGGAGQTQFRTRGWGIRNRDQIQNLTQ